MDTHCHDCKRSVDELREYWFMLFKRVWLEATEKSGDRSVICIECIERRLGRDLTSQDFDFRILCNLVEVRRSKRLVARMTDNGKTRIRDAGTPAKG